jgi:hypothetical protein
MKYICPLSVKYLCPYSIKYLYPELWNIYAPFLWNIYVLLYERLPKQTDSLRSNAKFFCYLNFQYSYFVFIPYFCRPCYNVQSCFIQLSPITYSTYLQELYIFFPCELWKMLLKDYVHHVLNTVWKICSPFIPRHNIQFCWKPHKFALVRDT